MILEMINTPIVHCSLDLNKNFFAPVSYLLCFCWYSPLLSPPILNFNQWAEVKLFSLISKCHWVPYDGGRNRYTHNNWRSKEKKAGEGKNEILGSYQIRGLHYNTVYENLYDNFQECWEHKKNNIISLYMNSFITVYLIGFSVHSLCMQAVFI